MLGRGAEEPPSPSYIIIIINLHTYLTKVQELGPRVKDLTLLIGVRVQRLIDQL